MTITKENYEKAIRRKPDARSERNKLPKRILFTQLKNLAARHGIKLTNAGRGKIVNSQNTVALVSNRKNVEAARAIKAKAAMPRIKAEMKARKNAKNKAEVILRAKMAAKAKELKVQAEAKANEPVRNIALNRLMLELFGSSNENIRPAVIKPGPRPLSPPCKMVATSSKKGGGCKLMKVRKAKAKQAIKVRNTLARMENEGTFKANFTLKNHGARKSALAVLNDQRIVYEAALKLVANAKASENKTRQNKVRKQLKKMLNAMKKQKKIENNKKAEDQRLKIIANAQRLYNEMFPPLPKKKVNLSKFPIGPTIIPGGWANQMNEFNAAKSK